MVHPQDNLYGRMYLIYGPSIWKINGPGSLGKASILLPLSQGAYMVHFDSGLLTAWVSFFRCISDWGLPENMHIWLIYIIQNQATKIAKLCSEQDIFLKK